MYGYRLIFWLLMGIGLPVQAQQAQADSNSDSRRIIFSVVEEPPQFPGGTKELSKYLKQNTRYPETSRKKKRKGTVFVNFVVTDKGKIEDIHVLKSLSQELDTEAVRVIQNMPDWIPAKQSGHLVNCRYNLPIHFD